MYRFLIRPVLFRFYPETVHSFVAALLKIFWNIPGIRHLIKSVYTYSNPTLQRTVFGIEFPNPVGLAAGFDKKGDLYNPLSMLGFGFIEIGTVTPKAQPGNPKPRSFRLCKDEALINRMGFNSIGLEKTLQNLRKQKPRLIIGGNIGKNTSTPNEDALNDYIAVFEGLYDWVDYFVVNVSCPNISNLTKLQDKDFLLTLLLELRERAKSKNKTKPILLKISPDLTLQQLDEIIEVATETQIDGIIAVNTTTTRENLITASEIIAKIGNGGLSGKPLKEKAIRVIRYVYQKTNGKIPIIGVGGIMTAQDAIDMIEAGASLIQVYTGFIYNGPGLVKRILKTIAVNQK